MNNTNKYKTIKTDKYLIIFDQKTGQEILSGINGNPDPFTLEYPSLMDLGVMGHCSNNCKICYQGNRDKPNMSLDHFKRIIDESKDHITQVALGGKGDPNLHENFKEIIEYCRLNGVIPNYTTSGNGLTEEQVILSKEFCGAVAVSAYDEKFTYDALNLLFKHGVKTNIHFVLSNHSIQNSINILKNESALVWLNKFDINKLNAIIFLLFKPQGNGSEHKDYIVCDDDIKLFRQNLKEAKTHYKIGIDSCLACRIATVCNDFTAKESLFIDTCEGARMSCYVTSDMKFMPCSFATHDKIGVPIIIEDKNSIKNIWKDSKVFTDFRNKLESNPNVCPLEF